MGIIVNPGTSSRGTKADDAVFWPHQKFVKAIDTVQY